MSKAGVYVRTNELPWLFPFIMEGLNRRELTHTIISHADWVIEFACNYPYVDRVLLELGTVCWLSSPGITCMFIEFTWNYPYINRVHLELPICWQNSPGINRMLIGFTWKYLYVNRVHLELPVCWLGSPGITRMLIRVQMELGTICWLSSPGITCMLIQFTWNYP